MKKMLFVFVTLLIGVTLIGCKQEPIELERIFISKMPDEISFLCGEPLDLGGLEVVAVYSDGSIKNIDNYTTEPKNGDLITTDDNFDVKISFEQKECSFSLNVVENYFDLPVITSQPLSYKRRTNTTVRLKVETEEVLEGILSYQWYESVDSINYTKVSKKGEDFLDVSETSESHKYYYVKITHSFTNEDGESRTANLAYKKSVSVKSNVVSVEFYEPIKILSTSEVAPIDLYSASDVVLEVKSQVYSDSPIEFHWFKKDVDSKDDVFLYSETVNINDFSEINYTSKYIVSAGDFKENYVGSFYYYVKLISKLENEEFSKIQPFELTITPNTGLKLLSIDTENSVEPTCRYLKTMTGLMAISDKEKVPGRVVLSQDTKILYDSGNYEKKKSGMTIKIRGNGSAYQQKKGFKIKLQKKADLLLRNDKSLKNKNWVLLADGTTLNTMFGFMIADIFGFTWTPKYEYVDLVINGNYRGVYMLVESIEEDEKRIDVSETGFIIERDGYVRVEAEYESLDTPPVYFETTMGMPMTFKYPEEVSESQIEYIRNVMNEFEQSLIDGNYDDYIDLESWTSWFLVHDVLGQNDTWGTNKYISKYDSSDSLLKMETPWDFGWLFNTELKIQNDISFYGPYLFNSDNKVFVNMYKTKWEKISKDLNNEVSLRMNDFASIYSDSLYKAKLLDSKRWNSSTKGTIEKNIEQIYKWLEKQIPIITERCEIL